MKFFDTHAHYEDEAFDKDRKEVILRARDSGIERIVNVGYNIEKSISAIKTANEYEYIYATVGIHPGDILKNIDFEEIERLAKDEKVVAIGEIGLDYHYEDCVEKVVQKEVFIRQIEMANKLKLPVIIHSRDADMDMLGILKGENRPKMAVMHCFSSSMEVAKEVIKQGYYISFAGAVTFKNANKLKEVVKIVPKNKLLIETDAPYLSPEPYRGKRNESSYIINTVKVIADIRGTNLEDIANITYNNACKFFNV